MSAIRRRHDGEHAFTIHDARSSRRSTLREALRKQVGGRRACAAAMVVEGLTPDDTHP